MTNFCAGWNISFGGEQSQLVYPNTIQFLPKEIADKILALPTVYPILEVYISWKSPLDDTVHGWVVAEHGGKVALLFKSHDRKGATAVQEITAMLRDRKQA